MSFQGYRRNYSTGEVASLLGVSQQTVIRCMDSGEIPSFRIPGSKFRRTAHESLMAWLEGRPDMGHVLDRLKGFVGSELPGSAAHGEAFGSLEVFTTGDLGRLFGWTPRTAAKILDSGEIPSYRVPGSADRRVTRSQLKAYLDSCGPELDPVRQKFEAMPSPVLVQA